MQYEITGVPETLDLLQFTRLMTDADPAAVVDLAPGARTLRMSTSLGTHAVLDMLGRTGVDAGSSVLEQVPSQCCGGCGG